MAERKYNNRMGRESNILQNGGCINADVLGPPPRRRPGLRRCRRWRLACFLAGAAEAVESVPDSLGDRFRRRGGGRACQMRCELRCDIKNERVQQTFLSRGSQLELSLLFTLSLVYLYRLRFVAELPPTCYGLAGPGHPARPLLALFKLADDPTALRGRAVRRGAPTAIEVEDDGG